MDRLKEAFSKVKSEIDLLTDAVLDIKSDLERLTLSNNQVVSKISTLSNINPEKSSPSSINKSFSFNPLLFNLRVSLPNSIIYTPINTFFPYLNSSNYTNPLSSTLTPSYTSPLMQTSSSIQTHKPISLDQQTDNSDTSTDRQTHNLPLEALKPSNHQVSNGNDGVQTDRQTDFQTDRHILNLSKISSSSKFPQFDKVNSTISSLDGLKSEIKGIFTSLTNQEMLIFSTIYSLQEENIENIDYNMLAIKLSLTESSIRDYINKLTKKGIPIEKTKINNKKIILTISEKLRKIAPLNTILSLKNNLSTVDKTFF